MNKHRFYLERMLQRRHAEPDAPPSRILRGTVARLMKQASSTWAGSACCHIARRASLTCAPMQRIGATKSLYIPDVDAFDLKAAVTAPADSTYLIMLSGQP